MPYNSPWVTPGPLGLAANSIVSGQLAAGSVLSGNIASGQIGGAHIAAGTIITVNIASGAAASGEIASGSVPGYFGTTRVIQSGTVGVFDFGSGAVITGTLGSGAVQSGNVASGQLGIYHLQSGLLLSGLIASGGIGSGSLIGSVGGGYRNIASGTIGTSDLGSGQIQSGNIGSGAVWGLVGTLPHISSGSFTGFELGSGSIVSGRVASGQLGVFHHQSGIQWSGLIQSGGVGSGAVTGALGGGYRVVASGTIGTSDLSSGGVLSGHITSGNVITFARNSFDDVFTTAAAVSGLIAVALASGGTTIIPAQPGSGLLMPSIGVNIANAVSGASIQIVRWGRVLAGNSGLLQSGFWGGPIYVGSGGLLATKSGTPAGALADGPGAAAFSGGIVQRMGISISGGVYVMPDMNLTSGLTTVNGLVW